jgi:hypothetical protein
MASNTTALKKEMPHAALFRLLSPCDIRQVQQMSLLLDRESRNRFWSITLVHHKVQFGLTAHDYFPRKDGTQSLSKMSAVSHTGQSVLRQSWRLRSRVHASKNSLFSNLSTDIHGLTFSHSAIRFQLQTSGPKGAPCRKPKNLPVAGRRSFRMPDESVILKKYKI